MGGQGTKMAPVPTALPRRSDEWWARAAASAVFLAALVATLYGARSMSGDMPMPGGWSLPRMWMVMPGQSTAAAAWMFLLMWQAMMVAMMLPSTWPMLVLYRRVILHNRLPSPVLSTLLVGVGYFTIWLAFGGMAFALGLGVSRAAMSSAHFSRMIPATAGVALVLAGAYQLSPLKQACLKHCREPLLFLTHGWRPGPLGGLRVGAHHGAFCAACCWALMLSQMILGAMNLAVMACVAALIALEKLWKWGPQLARLAGAGAVAAGLALVFRSF